MEEEKEGFNFSKFVSKQKIAKPKKEADPLAIKSKIII